MGEVHHSEGLKRQRETPLASGNMNTLVQTLTGAAFMTKTMGKQINE